MNVYDFDGTIYQGDSGEDFIKFAFSKKPLLMSKHLLKSLKYVLLYQMKKIEFQEMKEFLFSFVSAINNLEDFTLEFGKTHQKKLKKYYSKVRKDNDVIISASLDVYLLPLCKEIGLKNVICTKYDVERGKIIGKNCKLEEKVKRFEEVYGKEAKIESAYGDSKSDVPILKRAEKRICGKR